MLLPSSRSAATATRQLAWVAVPLLALTILLARVDPDLAGVFVGRPLVVRRSFDIPLGAPEATHDRLVELHRLVDARVRHSFPGANDEQIVGRVRVEGHHVVYDHLAFSFSAPGRQGLWSHITGYPTDWTMCIWIDGARAQARLSAWSGHGPPLEQLNWDGVWPFDLVAPKGGVSIPSESALAAALEACSGRHVLRSVDEAALDTIVLMKHGQLRIIFLAKGNVHDWCRQSCRMTVLCSVSASGTLDEVSPP